MEIRLTEKQQLAIKLYRMLGSDRKVGEHMGISGPSANRLRNRGLGTLRKVGLVVAAADKGGDPIDAIDAVKRVLDV